MAAESSWVLPPDSTGKASRAVLGTADPAGVQRQVVAVSDAEGNLLDGSGIVPGVGQTAAGTGGGTVTLTGGQRIVNLHAYANGADGTVTVGALVVTVRSGSGFDWTPASKQTAGSVVFSASIDFFLEWV